MFGKRALVIHTKALALPAWLMTDSAFNPVNVGIFMAALLFGMNA